jgi:hypothetical protein
MPVTVGRMTLKALLEQHGITTLNKFKQKAGLSRQHAWLLWWGETGVGKVTMARLHERLNIPLEELIALDPVVSPPKPRGRPKRERGDREDGE